MNCHVRVSIVSSLVARENKINAKIIKMPPEGLRRLSPRSRLYKEEEQFSLYFYLRSPGHDASILDDVRSSSNVGIYLPAHSLLLVHTKVHSLGVSSYMHAQCRSLRKLVNVC